MRAFLKLTFTFSLLFLFILFPIQLIDASTVTNSTYNEIQKDVDELSKKVADLSEALAQSQQSSKISSTMILIGLFIEVIGATALAGSILSSKIEEVFNYKVEADLFDLALSGGEESKTVNFYGFLGTMLIVIGFIIQFSAVVYSIGVGFIVTLLLIIIAIAVSTAIIYFLSGLTPGQSRKQKFTAIGRSIYRLFFLPVLNQFTKSIKCDICNRTVNEATGQVLYIEEENSKEYPYLHTPYSFLVGHPECVANTEDVIFIENGKRTGTLTGTFHIRKESLSHFKKESSPRINEFFQRYKQYWKERRNETDEMKNAHEEELKRVIEKLKNV